MLMYSRGVRLKVGRASVRVSPMPAVLQLWGERRSMLAQAILEREAPRAGEGRGPTGLTAQSWQTRDFPSFNHDLEAF